MKKEITYPSPFAGTLLILFITLAGHPAIGQGFTGFYGIINAGYQYSALPHAQKSEAEKKTYHYATMGIEGSYKFRKVILASNWQAGTSADPGIPELSVWSSHVKLGWLLVNRRSFWCYPAVGGGASSYSLNWPDQNRAGYPFGKAEARMTNPSLDGSFNFDFILADDDGETHVHGILIGTRIGYNTSIPRGQWKYSESIHSGMIPRLPQHGLYITVSFSGMGFFKR
jgi:hypothetical protein